MWPHTLTWTQLSIDWSFRDIPQARIAVRRYPNNRRNADYVQCSLSSLPVLTLNEITCFASEMQYQVIRVADLG
jgi:hypothetical protein